MLYIILPFSSVFIFCSVIFWYTYFNMYIQKQQTMYLEQYQAIQHLYYQKLLDSAGDMRILRHDIRNHLHTLGLLTNKPSLAFVYLEQIKSSLATASERYSISPSLFSVVLDSCDSLAFKKNCYIKVETLSNDKFTNCFSFCQLFFITVFFATQNALPNTCIEIVCHSDPTAHVTVVYKAHLMYFLDYINLHMLRHFVTEYGGNFHLCRKNRSTSLSITFPLKDSDSVATHFQEGVF